MDEGKTVTKMEVVQDVWERLLDLNDERWNKGLYSTVMTDTQLSRVMIEMFPDLYGEAPHLRPCPPSARKLWRPAAWRYVRMLDEYGNAIIQKATQRGRPIGTGYMAGDGTEFAKEDEEE